MRAKWYLAIVAVATLASFALSGRGAGPETTGAPEATANAPEFKNLSDLKWDKILPDLGADSPEISILHVDPKTHATSLLIRTLTAIHVRKHWHTANEMHTIIRGTATLACDGKKFDLNPGGFNLMPAKMVHEGVVARKLAHLHRGRWRMGPELDEGPADRGRFNEIGRLTLDTSNVGPLMI